MQTNRVTLNDQRLASADQWGCGLPVPAPIIGSGTATRSTKSAALTRGASRGFTLIELMLVLAVAGILSGIAYPSFMGQLQKIRRADALVAFLQVQAAQERWRSNNPGYATSAQLGVGAMSSAGHYALQINEASELGYEVLATAQGAQAHDTACRFLRLRSDAGNLVQTSGPDIGATNSTSANRQCWSM